MSRTRNPGKFTILSLISVLMVIAPMALLAIQPPADGGARDPRAEVSDERLRAEPTLDIFEMGATEARTLPAMQQFFDRYSAQWEVRHDVRSNRPHLIQGVGVPLLPGRGNSLSRANAGLPATGAIQMRDVEQLVRSFLTKNRDLFRVADSDLRLDISRSVKYGDGDYLWMIELQQHKNGVPVEDAYVYARINHGNIVQFGSHRISEVGISTVPSVGRERAFDGALRSLDIRAPIQEILDRGSLKILPVLAENESFNERYIGTAGKGYQHLLAWEYVFRLQGDAHTYKVVVDAQRGTVIQYLDLTKMATVEANIYPVTNTDPLVTVGLPFASVSNGGTVITDADGNYTYGGGTATVQLDGRYVNINDNCGSISLSDSTDGNIDFGGAGGIDCTTPGFGGAGNTHSARSGFYHLTNINRKAASFLTTNSWLDGTLTANMNINLTCNAFWNGSTVNFYRSGGGCSNTGEIAAVFLHEWGHGMDTNSGGAANENGSGEAVGDTFAFLETRDACIGENFLPGSPCANCRPFCTGVRDVAAFANGGISTIARPDTIESNTGINCDRFSCPYFQQGIFPYQGPMGYQGHCESHIASGATWDLTQLLIAEHGTDPGWALMDSIWYGSLFPTKSAYRVASGGTCNPSASVDGCAASNWYTAFLPVDDDDGNLANGTPNACRIWQAFDDHGIACGTQPPCSNACTPTAVADAGPDQTICAGDSANLGTAALAGHSYSWAPGGQTTAQITVTPGATTTYTVTATTSCGNAQDSATVTVDSGSGGGLDDDFEGGLGSWTASGLWHLTTNSACASPGFSSASNAVYYGQDSTCTYNSGAANTGDLISPAITGINSSSELSFDYFRQVESFTGGSFDQTEVAVSVAGSGSWTTVWSRDSTNASASAWTPSGAISLASFAGQTIQVRFRFSTVDGSFNDFIGWFIDDVSVTADSPCGPGGNTAPTVTITAPANGSSFVEGTSVSFSGTATDAEDGTLTASLSWSSNLDGAIGSGGSFSTSGLSVGTHTITASVTDSGGLSDSDAISVTIDPTPNTAPTVTITAPANGSSFVEGTSVSFSGTATDPEDGTLTASLSWSSNLDGAIGSGGSFSTSGMSVGTHTITASVTDSGGLSDSDAISVTIDPTPNTAPTVTITAPASGASFEQGTSVSFSGTATDPEDGTLTASLSWSSNPDGAIGSGGSFSTSGLSVGTHTITASVTDSGGLSGSDAISVTITQTPVSGVIDWNTTATAAYSNQDGSGSEAIEDGGATLFLTGNRWRRTTQTYTITPNTVIELDFQSTAEGEIHGIGFDTDDTLTNNIVIFQLHGTQNWTSAHHQYDDYSGSSFVTYRIPVGGFYEGSGYRLVLVNDKDAGTLDNTSRFRNVRIYEDGAAEPTVNWSAVSTVAYSNQDNTGTVNVEDAGATLFLEGNRWRRTTQTYTITANTVVSFEYLSTSEGEIHGLGFDVDDTLTNDNRIFNVYGTQTWSFDIDWVQQYDSSAGSYKTFVIPVGRYYTGTGYRLVLTNDKDAGTLNNDGRFRNVRIYELD